jgi:hypothetical protein
MLPLLTVAEARRDREGKVMVLVLAPEYRAFNAAVNLANSAMTHARTGLGVPSSS